MPRKAKAPPSPFSGLDFDSWQRSPLLVSWARKDEMFSNVLAVVQNGFATLPESDFKGYQRAFNLLLGLRIAVEEPKPLPPADYRTSAEGFEGGAEEGED